MKYPKRSQYKHAKSQYRVRNWPQHETGLRRRRDLSVWLSDEALDAWHETPNGKPGGQRTYADIAIEAALESAQGPSLGPPTAGAGQSVRRTSS